ncbi:hypothetical protein BKA70DRAFT_44440 [Coprinopsis sp. MPI-PUGE-AT-0042]|nr:hypothetical protein BKA70DRAFT_44440 [Coprinopsis sp. MPI-PUGE-AT-0042]
MPRRTLTQLPSYPIAPSSMEFSGWDRLMKTLLSKAYCRNLLVEVDDQQCDVPSELVEEAILGGYYGVKGALNRIRLGLGKAFVTPFRWFGIELSSGLEEFDVHSPILFHPALCHWTLSTLRQPNVTSVSLDHLQTIQQETWRLLLPLISIPSLSKLSINLCSAPTEDLFVFLARHPQLEELSLGPNIAPLNSNATLPKNAPPQAPFFNGYRRATCRAAKQ